jgi:hypothetical protein
MGGWFRGHSCSRVRTCAPQRAFPSVQRACIRWASLRYQRHSDVKPVGTGCHSSCAHCDAVSRACSSVSFQPAAPGSQHSGHAHGVCISAVSRIGISVPSPRTRMPFNTLCHGAATFLLFGGMSAWQLCGAGAFCVYGAILHGYCASAGCCLANLRQKDRGSSAFRVSLLLSDSPNPSFSSLAQMLCALRASPAAVTTAFAPGARASGLRTLSEPPGLVGALDGRGGR